MYTRIAHGVAGTFILTGIVLSVFISRWWLLLPAFVGLNLLQNSLSNWCFLFTILRKLGIKNTGQSCSL